MGESSPFSIFPSLPRPPREPDLPRLTGWADNFHRATMALFGRMNQNLASGLVVPTGAAHSGGYGTTTVAGSATSFLRSDTRLLFPDTLMVLGAPTKTLQLTDSATGGVLTGAGFTANAIGIIAPSAVSAITGLWVDSNGRLSASGTVPGSFNAVMAFKNTNNAFSGAQGYGIYASAFGAVGNTAPLTGIYGEAQDQGATNASDIIGGEFLARHTANGATGNLIGVKASVQRGASGTIARMTNFYSWKFVSAIGATQSVVAHFEADNAAISGTTPKQIAFYQGTAFSSGSTKRGVQVVNSMECTANDAIFSTAAKGPIFKDTQGTPRFWRLYSDATGVAGGSLSIDSFGVVTGQRDTGPTGSITLFLQDVGTSAPTA